MRRSDVVDGFKRAGEIAGFAKTAAYCHFGNGVILVGIEQSLGMGHAHQQHIARYVFAGEGTHLAVELSMADT